MHKKKKQSKNNNSIQKPGMMMHWKFADAHDDLSWTTEVDLVMFTLLDKQPDVLLPPSHSESYFLCERQCILLSV